MARLVAFSTMAWLRIVGKDIFTKNTEVRFVCRDAQHNKVGIKTVDDVSGSCQQPVQCDLADLGETRKCVKVSRLV